MNLYDDIIQKAPMTQFIDVLNKSPNVGLLLEFGVYSGNSIKTIANNFPDRTVWGFDSFEGLQEEWNGYKVGVFKVEELPTDLPPNVQLVKGYFEDTLNQFLSGFVGSGSTIAFMHIDCDLYSSTKTIFKECKHYIIPGTVIAFDELIDYGNEEWKNHEYKAFNEYLLESGREVECIGKYGINQVAFKMR